MNIAIKILEEQIKEREVRSSLLYSTITQTLGFDEENYRKSLEAAAAESEIPELQQALKILKAHVTVEAPVSDCEHTEWRWAGGEISPIVKKCIGCGEVIGE